ncbi:MAG: hypothetical protein SGI87_00830 [Flavobacteriales bacterium]|nr:hypothetical protein [Flavobacteriales bacterium]
MITLRDLKLKVHSAATELMLSREKEIRHGLKEIREGLSNDAKSTAGDKHETAIAMAQIECERMEKQLSEVLNQKSKLDRIDSSIQTNIISQGSLVKTNRGFFYLSIPIGKLNVDISTIIAMSPESPLGNAFISSKIGDTVTLNNVAYLIEEIC